jgi:filamentous hemagglutinin
MLPGYYPLYPRGAGAAAGPLPPGHIIVSRWIGEAEARTWMANGATYVPPGLGAGGHLSVAEYEAPRIPGTGPI